MSLSWRQRKTRLGELVGTQGDENADGATVDRLMHGQSVIGKTSKTSEIDGLRFQDKDLIVAGALEYGQFGQIDVVTCRIDNRVYVRKSIEKGFALRTREQCSPQTERDILVRATLTDSPWAPHLLVAYQMPTHLHLVMEYAEGGNLWDVLESSPYDGKILESDLRWWAPQVVSAIHWCHSQGFAHRDIKPHNFVLTRDSHLLLIDFGSAAPLLPGTQSLPKKHCLIPCGTCDYISPEILKAHEEALVALEMEEDEPESDVEGYGLETDWWSFGAMMYEMVYGAAPFFANEIRHTYQRIINHGKSLRFPDDGNVSPNLRDLVSCLLTDAERRLGRKDVLEITDHPFFHGVNWTSLSTESPPPELHLPQFTYNEPPPQADVSAAQPSQSEAYSQGFAFSALFQSSKASSPGCISVLRSTGPSLKSSASLRDDPNTSFIGFSWGPTIDAFPDPSSGVEATPLPNQAATPAPLRMLSVPATPAFNWPENIGKFTTPGHRRVFSTPGPNPLHYMTPVRAYSFSPMHTIQRTSTIRRTASRRPVSDREAMKQLVDCIGMSARKKVLESGRKPRILTSFSQRYSQELSGDRISISRGKPMSATAPTTTTTNGTGTVRKELRFFPTPTPIPNNNNLNFSDYSLQNSEPSIPKARLAPLALERPSPWSGGYGGYSASETESDGPPSPSPTPRPGSAMSRRSGTPTLTSTFSSARLRSGSASSSSVAIGAWSAATQTNATTSSSSLFSRVRDSSASVGSVSTMSGVGSKFGGGHRRTGSGSSLRRLTTMELSYADEPSVAARGSFRKMTTMELSYVDEQSAAAGGYTRREGGSEDEASEYEESEEAETTREYGSDQEDEDEVMGSRQCYGNDEDSEPEDYVADDDSHEQVSSSAKSRTDRSVWDEMEFRHSRMMLEIGQLEERLEHVSRSIRPINGR